MKTVALLGGGDWTDASVDLLVIPDDMDVLEMQRQWDLWYVDEYLPSFGYNTIKFKSLAEFMLEKGAKRSDIEEYEI